jgi:hypothetical protein
MFDIGNGMDDCLFDEEYWWALFRPVKNPSKDQYLFACDDDDSEIVEETLGNYVWTWVAGKKGENDKLINGRFPKKAKGYYITEVGHNMTQKIVIDLEP